MKKLILALLIFMIALIPVNAAHITKFNGVTASTSDQVSTVRLAKDQVGYVTVVFNKGYTLNSNYTKLILTFNCNISKYSYTATGDTANLTVTRNPNNLTFVYKPYSSVTISDIYLTFDYGHLTSDKGINTNVAMKTIEPLAYVSYFGKTLTSANTTEKISYIVYDPTEVYAISYSVVSPKNVTMKFVNDTLMMNLYNATTNMLEIKITVKRGYYNDTLVPLESGKFALLFNDIYVTSLMTKNTINCTEVGSIESHGYTKLIYIDNNVNATKYIYLSGNFWNTNGTIKDAILYNYTVDPVGGLTANATKDNNLNVTAAALGVPPSTAMWWFAWKLGGIPLLAWIAILFSVTLIAFMIWRYKHGMSPIPKSASAQGIIVASWTFLAVLATLKDLWHNAFTWIADNPVPGAIMILLITALLWLAKIHLLSTKE